VTTEQYHHWQRAITRMYIGETRSRDQVSVCRAANNHFRVTVNGATEDIGGRAMAVSTAVALALSSIRRRAFDGAVEPIPCARCKIAPRTTHCYCEACANELNRTYVRRRRAKLKEKAA